MPATLFNVLQPVVDIVLVVQAFWFVMAAVVLLLRRGSQLAAGMTTNPDALTTGA